MSMKLDEAAAILGVSLEDITIDGLKQTYKKLAHAWDPSKCKDQTAKQKYMQISEAYKKINSVMEGSDGESREVAAFMRMFMDMVGISDSDSIPAAMTFGMMFGARPPVTEEWSTDDDDDGDADFDDDDEDDDDEDYLIDDGLGTGGTGGGIEHLSTPGCPLPLPLPALPPHDTQSHSSSSSSSSTAYRMTNVSSATTRLHPHPPLQMPSKSQQPAEVWEPQVKQYSNMNLKDQVKRERQTLAEAADGEAAQDADKEKKLKQAKKRAEKRRKQKEKSRLREREGKAAAGTDASASSSSATAVNMSMSQSISAMNLDNPEFRRLIEMSKERIKLELYNSISAGDVEKVQHFMQSRYSETLPAHISQVLDALVKKDLPSACLFHRCLTDYASIEGNMNLPPNTVSSARRELLQYLIEYDNPSLDLNARTSDGLSVIHTAVVYGDVSSLSILVTRGKGHVSGGVIVNSRLDIDKRCGTPRSWTAIHYSIDCVNIEAMRLLLRAGADLTNGEDGAVVEKGKTSSNSYLKMVRAKLKLVTTGGPNVSISSSAKKTIQLMLDELQAAVDARKKAASPVPVPVPSPIVIPTPGPSSGDKNDSFSNDDEDLANFYEKTRANGGSNKEKKSVKVAPTAAAKKDEGNKPATTNSSSNSANTNSSSSSSSTTAQMKTIESKKKKKEKTPGPSTPTEPSSSSNSNNVQNSNTKGGQTPTGKSGASGKASTIPAPVALSRSSSAPASLPQTSSSSSSSSGDSKISLLSELSVASRDELVDRLLAMGFKEADCLAAIALYGTDVDRAISWLCEKPPTVADSKVKPAEESARVRNASVSSAESAPSPAVVALEAAAPTSAPVQNAAKLQKEKEELRRINRAWNAKAEDEKRKVEQMKKAAEAEKQRELALQKQQQQQAQAQQQAFEQQYLQQLLQQQQQQQQQQQALQQLQQLQQQQQQQQQHQQVQQFLNNSSQPFMVGPMSASNWTSGSNPSPPFGSLLGPTTSSTNQNHNLGAQQFMNKNLPGLSLPGGPLSDLLGKSPFLPPTHTSAAEFSLQQQQQQQQLLAQQQSSLSGHGHNQQMFSSFPFPRNGGPAVPSNHSPSPIPASSRVLSEVAPSLSNPSMGLLDSRLTSLPSPASIQASHQHHMGNLPLQMNNMGMGNLPASLSFAQQPNLPLSSGFAGFAKPTSGFVSSSSSHRDVMEDISNDEGTLVDGAVELSAGARPFIPKGFSSGFGSNNDTQHTQRSAATLPFGQGQGHNLFMHSGNGSASGGIIGYGDASSSWGVSTSTSGGPFDSMGKLSLQLPHSLLSVPSEVRTQQQQQQQQQQQRSRGHILGHPSFAADDSNYGFELDEEATQQLPANLDSFLLDVVDSPDMKFFDHPTK